MATITPAAIAEVPERIRVQSNPYQGVLEIFGPPVFDRRSPPTIYLLETSIDPRRPGAEDSFRLRIVGFFPKRVFLKSAFADGRPLPTKAHDRERIDCGYDCAIAETIFISVSEEELARWTMTGLPLQIVGRRTRITMLIPGSYLQAVMDRHVTERTRLSSRKPP